MNTTATLNPIFASGCNTPFLTAISTRGHCPVLITSPQLQQLLPVVGWLIVTVLIISPSSEFKNNNNKKKSFHAVLFFQQDWQRRTIWRETSVEPSSRKMQPTCSPDVLTLVIPGLALPIVAAALRTGTHVSWNTWSQFRFPPYFYCKVSFSLFR